MQGLLQYQDCDVRKYQLESKLQGIPTEIAWIDNKYRELKSARETEKAAVEQLDLQRRALEGELKSSETQLLKYKNQQLEAKKSDEYDALTESIRRLAEKIAGLEDQGLQWLLEIDTKRSQLQDSEEGYTQNIQGYEAEMARLQEQLAQVQRELGEAADALAALEGGLPPVLLTAYKQVKTRVKKPPYVAPLQDQKCTGCHLKVSNETQKQARNTDVPHYCDHCGRMVYFPPEAQS